MSMICPKCKYVRTAADQAPGWQCPACGVAYLKVRGSESNPTTAKLASTLDPAADPSESAGGGRRMLPFALAGVTLVLIGVAVVYRPSKPAAPALTGAADVQGTADTTTASLLSAQTSTDGIVRLTCGDRTYRLSSDKIDDDIQAACEQTRQSLAAMQAYQAATVQYTCRDGEGPVQEGRTVQKYLLDDYTRNCQEYVVAEETIRSGTQDRSLNHNAAFAAHRAAAKKFTDKSNEIALRGAADANALYQQKTTNEAHLYKLIKRAGGSIETAG
jgi:hypothetical protein